jgi:hypothetical protein
MAGHQCWRIQNAAQQSRAIEPWHLMVGQHDKRLGLHREHVQSLDAVTRSQHEVAGSSTMERSVSRMSWSSSTISTVTRRGEPPNRWLSMRTISFIAVFPHRQAGEIGMCSRRLHYWGAPLTRETPSTTALPHLPAQLAVPLVASGPDPFQLWHRISPTSGKTVPVDETTVTDRPHNHLTLVSTGVTITSRVNRPLLDID